MKNRYSDYCTAWSADGKVYFYDEIKDKIIEEIEADETTALEILKNWKANAPKNCICDII